MQQRSALLFFAVLISAFGSALEVSPRRAHGFSADFALQYRWLAWQFAHFEQQADLSNVEKS